MDFIITQVLPILAFVIAVITGWDKLAAFAKLMSQGRRKIIAKNALRDLERIETYSSNPSLLIAHQSKQLFILLGAILFVSLLGFPSPNEGAIFLPKMVIILPLFFVAGFSTGNALRVARYVLQADSMRIKLEERVARYSD